MAHSVGRSRAVAAGFLSPELLSNRALVFLAIVGLHGVLVYLLASGLGKAAVTLVMKPFDAIIVPETPHEERPPPAQPVQLREAVIDPGPLPDEPIAVPEDPGTALALPPVADPPPVHPPVAAAPPEPIRLVGQHRLANTEDHYPPVKIRAGIEGAADVRVCVDERGKIDGSPSILKSSGDTLLDQGALEVVREGHYARAKRGETFVPNCYSFRIVFKLRH